MGQVLELLRHLEDALLAYKEALKRRPSDWRLWAATASLYMRLQEDQKNARESRESISGSSAFAAFQQQQDFREELSYQDAIPLNYCLKSAILCYEKVAALTLQSNPKEHAEAQRTLGHLHTHLLLK
jgi:tetratricopeptide (TPR) repeat protein